MDAGFLVITILLSLIILGSLFQVIRCIVKKEFKTKFIVFIVLFLIFLLILIGFLKSMFINFY